MAETSKYDITVVPKSIYVEDQSDPSKDQYVFAYRITISNTGSVPAQLISRHWIITDANGKVLEVKSLGVVAQQPLLKPGESFECPSGTHLDTTADPVDAAHQNSAEDG